MGASAKNVDFSKVKEGGNFNKKRIPAGDYLAKITKVEDAPAKGDGTFQYLFTIKIVKRPASILPYYCKLQENQLWKLRGILIAAGKSVPKTKSKVDPNSIVGKLIGVTIEDSDYDGKEQSEINGVFPASELEDHDTEEIVDDSEEDEDEEEDDAEDTLDDDEPEAEEEEPEEEEEEAGDEYDAMDRLGLRKVLQKLDASIKTSKAQSDDDLRELIRGLNAKAAAPKAKPKAAAKPAKKPKAADISDDELEELDIDDL